MSLPCLFSHGSILTINSTCRNQRNAIPVSQTLCKEVGTPIKMDANMKRKMSTVNKTNTFGMFKCSDIVYADVSFKVLRARHKVPTRPGKPGKMRVHL